MNLKYLIIVLLIQITETSLIKLKKRFVQEEFSKFFRKLTKCKIDVFPTCYFSSRIPLNLKEATDWFISQNTCAPLHFRNFDRAMNLKFKIQRFYIFRDSIDSLLKIMENISTDAAYDPMAEICFVITCRVKNKDFLNTTLPYIWSKNISKFVIVFVHQKLEVYTYFPFESEKIKKIKKFGNTCQKLFEDKVKNLNGAPLRAAVFERLPYTELFNGTWRGQDILNFKHIAKELNATTEIIGTTNYHLKNGTSAMLYSNRADVIMVRLFESFYFNNTTSSYPFGIDHKVALVPRPRKVPQYEHFFEVFDPYVELVALLASLCLLILIWFLSQDSKIDFVRILMTLWAISWLTPAPNFKKYKGRVKMLLLIWFFCFIVINSTFGTSLMSQLVSGTRKAPIKTLEELKHSNLSIYIADYFYRNKNITNYAGLKEKFIPVLQPEYLLRDKNLTFAAYIVRLDSALYFCDQNLDDDGYSEFAIVDESLIPGVSVYSLQKNSPFYHAFSRGILLIQQFGFTKLRDYKKNRRKHEEILKLRMSHLSVLFWILIIGNCFAMLVFFIEITWYRYNAAILDNMSSFCVRNFKKIK